MTTLGITQLAATLTFDRINVVKATRPLAPGAHYFGVIHAHEDGHQYCAVVHQLDQVPSSAHPEVPHDLLRYLHGELWPKRALGEIIFADIIFRVVLSRTPLCSVQFGQFDSSAAKITWTRPDLEHHDLWVTRALPAIKLLVKLHD